MHSPSHTPAAFRSRCSAALRTLGSAILRFPRPPIGRTLAILVVALPLAALPLQAQRAVLERVIQRRVLANGLEVIVVENHGVPLATIELDVRNGGFTQTPEFAGLAHMYEHMFFRANASYPDGDRFAARASELGAVYNATTEEERVNYYVTLSSDSLAGGMRFVAAALRTPLFRQDELERERRVVLGEYDEKESNPFFALTQAMTRRLYPGHESRKNVIGDRDVIARVTRAQMQEIRRRYYVPNNSALLITGDVIPDSAFALAERIFGDWPRGADPFVESPIPPLAPLSADDAVIIEAPVGAVTVLLQWQGPSVGKDPDATYAADVFSDALNQPTSNFQQRLVDSGLWQGVGVNYYTLNQNGPITISGQTSAGKFREALAALTAEIEKLDYPGYFTAAELAEVKTQRAVESAFGRERTSGLTHTIGFWWSVASLEYFLGYVDRMAQQTPADLRRYAARYIVGKPKVTGVLMSAADKRQVALREAELVGGKGGGAR